MNKDEALKLMRKLTNMECYNEKSMQELLSYVSNIKQIISVIEAKKPEDGYNLSLSYGQLLESEGYLRTWVKNPKKSTMHTTFREYRGDFISVLNDYIKLGDEYSLWQSDNDDKQ